MWHRALPCTLYYNVTFEIMFTPLYILVTRSFWFVASLPAKSHFQISKSHNWGLKNDKFGFANFSFNQFNSRNRDSTMFSLFIVSICPICISVLRQQDVTSAKIDSKSTSYMRSDGQHAPLYAETLQTMYKTYPWHIGTCTYLLVQFVLSETFIPTRYQTSELQAETTHYSAGRNLKER